MFDPWEYYEKCRGCGRYDNHDINSPITLLDTNTRLCEFCHVKVGEFVKVRAEFNAKDIKIFREICQLLSRCNTQQAAAIANEVLMSHPIITFNPVTKSVDVIESVSVNGESIQLNAQEYEIC